LISDLNTEYLDLRRDYDKVQAAIVEEILSVAGERIRSYLAYTHVLQSLTSRHCDVCARLSPLSMLSQRWHLLLPTKPTHIPDRS
jgi:hypothetical protein